MFVPCLPEFLHKFNLSDPLSGYPRAPTGLELLDILRREDRGRGCNELAQPWHGTHGFYPVMTHL